MLARVLLHVIETARPVDAAENVGAAGTAVDDVNDFLAVVAHVKNVGVADFAEVMRLAA